MTDYRKSIIEQSKTINELYSKMKNTFRSQPHGPEHIAACNEFHQYYGKVAQQINAMINCNEANQREATEFYIQFLEVNPRFFRSGYLKQSMLRKLKHATLDKSQKVYLRRIIMAHMTTPYFTREYVYYARLAIGMNDDVLIGQIKALAEHWNSHVVAKAQGVLKRIPSKA